jgi:hypothetical protein
MVQLSRSSSRSRQFGVHNLPDDSSNSRHAHSRRWRVYFYTVRYTSDRQEQRLTFNRQAHQTVLLAIFVLCLFGTICSFPTNWLHRIVLWFAPINSTKRVALVGAKTNATAVIASICICIALLILTPNKRSPQWVFTTVMDGSGWGSKGFSFLLGCVYSEEHRDASEQILTMAVSYQ